MPSNFDIPDFVEPLDAHRFWALDSKGYLTSVSVDRGTPWLPNAVRTAHTVPTSKDTLGLHAYKSPDFLRPAMSSTVGDRVGVALVFGSVKVWGTIVEHRYGYRSTHAMVNEIHGVVLHDKLTKKEQEARRRASRLRVHSFDELLKLLIDKNGYTFRAIDTPVGLHEVRPGLYKRNRGRNERFSPNWKIGNNVIGVKEWK
jgi:hypothetical protein